jgi:hypothetical protein
MPLLHCVKCHHEWEAAEIKGLEPVCDWCGAHAYVLEKDTPLERMLSEIEKIGIERFLNANDKK